MKILNHCCQDFEVIVIAVIKEGNLLQTYNCTNLYYVVPTDLVEHLEVKWGQAKILTSNPLDLKNLKKNEKAEPKQKMIINR